VSYAQNGVGAFIRQCKRMEFRYCDWGGSSEGMRHYLKSRLPTFASQHPSIEFFISKQANAHPIIRGVYLNGREKVICVRNLDQNQIQQKAELLRDSSGKKLKRVIRKVETDNSSVRGIWSPFHLQDINKSA